MKVYAGTDLLTGREIRLRKTCKTERAAQIELGREAAAGAVGREVALDLGIPSPGDGLLETAGRTGLPQRSPEGKLRGIEWGVSPSRPG